MRDSPKFCMPMWYVAQKIATTKPARINQSESMNAPMTAVAPQPAMAGKSPRATAGACSRFVA